MKFSGMVTGKVSGNMNAITYYELQRQYGSVEKYWETETIFEDKDEAMTELKFLQKNYPEKYRVIKSTGTVVISK